MCGIQVVSSLADPGVEASPAHLFKGDLSAGLFLVVTCFVCQACGMLGHGTLDVFVVCEALGCSRGAEGNESVPASTTKCLTTHHRTVDGLMCPAHITLIGFS